MPARFQLISDCKDPELPGVDAEASRLTDLGATLTGAMSAEGLDWYAVGMTAPKATSSLSTDAFARRGWRHATCLSCGFNRRPAR
jgi:hypothetical protein